MSKLRALQHRDDLVHELQVHCAPGRGYKMQSRAGRMMSEMRRFGELKCDGGLTGARRGLILVQLDPRTSNPAWPTKLPRRSCSHGRHEPDICYLLPAGRRRLADTLDRLDLLLLTGQSRCAIQAALAGSKVSALRFAADTLASDNLGRHVLDQLIQQPPQYLRAMHVRHAR
jgi:hypothetical protein